MPKLVAANLSNNKQWEAQDLHDGLTELAEGPSQTTLQLLYLTDNSLEELLPHSRTSNDWGCSI